MLLSEVLYGMLVMRVSSVIVQIAVGINHPPPPSLFLIICSSEHKCIFLYT